MSTVIDPKATFLGMRIVECRDLLRLWHFNRDVRSIATNKKVGRDVRTVAVFVDQAEMNGWFGFQEQLGRQVYDMTDSGKSFLAATPLKPLRRNKAKEIVDELLQRCSKINKRNDLPFTIEKIWAFGSYITGANEVNDIDFVIEEGRVETRSIMDSSYSNKLCALACKMGRSGSMYAHEAFSYVRKKLIYGDRQNTRLSENSLTHLQAMACPCQLVFDASRGGLVNDPVLAKHPQAGDRDKTFAAPRVLPPLVPTMPHTPVSMDHVAPHGILLPFIGSKDPHFAARDEICHVTAYISPVSVDNANSEFEAAIGLASWLSARTDLDGRKTAALVHHNKHDEKQPTGIVVTRDLAVDASGIRYVLDVSDVYMDKRRRVMEDSVEGALAAHLAIAAGIDIEKAVRTATTRQLPIEIDVTCSNQHAGAKRLASMVRHELTKSKLFLSADARNTIEDHGHSLRVLGQASETLAPHQEDAPISCVL